MTCHRPYNTQMHQSGPIALAILTTALLSPTGATANERIAVTEVRPLLIQAIKQGEAHGVLTGTGAAYMQHRFETSNPIEVDVRRLHTLKRPGCARLDVATHQRAALVNGQRQDQQLVYQLNFCADGSFPKE